ncbi:MAG TPA: helix-turn-helix transcriptional regulator [Chloroflexota bacterium]
MHLISAQPLSRPIHRAGAPDLAPLQPAAVRDLRAKQFKYRLLNAVISRRQQLSLTQAQLSERSGIAQTEISRIERGRKSPTIDTYARMAAAMELELPPGWARSLRSP